MERNPQVYAKTRAEIAFEYGISRRTLYNWLKKEKIDLENRHLIKPKELEQIYTHFGKPRISLRKIKFNGQSHSI